MCILCCKDDVITTKNRTESILVIRYGTIGDSIFASAFFRELRNSYKDAKIDILVDEISKQVMKNCPYINNIYDIGDNKKLNIIKFIKLFKQYDTIYFLKNDRFFTITAFLAGVKNRIGFDVKRNAFLTYKRPYKDDKHEIDCYLDLLSFANIKPTTINTEVWIDEKTELKVKDDLLNILNKKILIQTYSRMHKKNWLDDYWVKVIEYLSNNLNCQIFFSGGNKDFELYNNLLNKCDKLKNKPINICGKYSVIESMALIKNVDLVIGVDSCAVHIAAAVDIPSILLNGPTSLVRWKPRSDKCIVLTKNFECSPCFLEKNAKKLCKHTMAKCMIAITPDMVIDKIKQVI